MCLEWLKTNLERGVWEAEKWNRPGGQLRELRRQAVEEGLSWAAFWGRLDCKGASAEYPMKLSLSLSFSFPHSVDMSDMTKFASSVAFWCFLSASRNWDGFFWFYQSLLIGMFNYSYRRSFLPIGRRPKRQPHVVCLECLLSFWSRIVQVFFVCLSFWQWMLIFLIIKRKDNDFFFPSAVRFKRHVVI